MPALVAALWWAGKDEWNKAHEIVMNREDPDCARVHAHLAEWTAIAAFLLAS
jgi:hypothetical protein